MGFCLCQISASAEAIDHYLAVLEGGMSNAAVHNNLGYCYSNLHKYDEAKKHFDEALRLDDRLRTAYFNRSQLDCKLVARSSTSSRLCCRFRGGKIFAEALELGRRWPTSTIAPRNICNWLAERSDVERGSF